jgi:hypothetical protein
MQSKRVNRCMKNAKIRPFAPDAGHSSMMIRVVHAECYRAIHAHELKYAESFSDI